MTDVEQWRIIEWDWCEDATMITIQYTNNATHTVWTNEDEIGMDLCDRFACECVEDMQAMGCFLDDDDMWGHPDFDLDETTIKTRWRPIATLPVALQSTKELN